MLLTAGTQAPEFTLQDENGVEHKLADYRGQAVVLYFYPKDDTPGCTTEACNFHDDYSAYQKAGVTILGVSPDNVKSHTRFKTKYDLPYTLLADEGHKVCEAYGVWGRKKMMGREYDGVFRTTYLIDPEGKISHVFADVKPAQHSAEVLAAIGAA